MTRGHPAPKRARVRWRWRGRALVALSVALLALLVAARSASALHEGGATWGNWGEDPSDCVGCHTEPLMGASNPASGPHGRYSATSRRCEACHFVHAAPAGGMVLLREPTITANCMVCHDGTGGSGVYGTLAARGVTVGAAHRVDVTSTIPGGDRSTGGDRTHDGFAGVGGAMACSDCHSPHGANVVEPFRGERIRTFLHADRFYRPEFKSDRLLRQRPESSDTTATVYGSDWCAGCHRGRLSGLGSVMNHPVDASDTHPDPFHYGRVALVATDISHETTIGPMGPTGTYKELTFHNRGYVMPYPRTPLQEGHAPICQQCHEDSRRVGSVGAVEPAVVIPDGEWETGNPRFLNFPHEAENRRFLVETGDDICLNCHPASVLP